MQLEILCIINETEEWHNMNLNRNVEIVAKNKEENHKKWTTRRYKCIYPFEFHFSTLKTKEDPKCQF
jgi:hypothetical protein